MRDSASRRVAALALAAWAAPSALDAQEPADAAAAQAVDASPLDGLRRGRDAFIGARDFSAALAPAESIVDAQRDAARAAIPGGPRGARVDPGGAARDSTTRSTTSSKPSSIVVDAEGEYSPTLIEYYRGLGRTYIKSAASTSKRS